MRTSNFILVLGFGALVGTGGGIAAYRFLPASPLVRGLYVGERRLPDRPGEVVGWLGSRNLCARTRTVRFRHEDRLFTASFAEAGVEIDVGATLEGARRVGHTGSFAARVREAERARAGAIDVPLVWDVDEGRARAFLTALAPALARAPVDARVDLAHHARIPDVPGQALDVESSLFELQRSAHDDDEIVPLVVRHPSAKVTLTELASVAVEKTVAAFETTFVTWGVGANRAVNIRNAASRIDGTVLAPGEVFSFNDTVGPRSRENGFALAPEIKGDELLDGYGGGTCQASSTLHAAALFAALGIVERRPHSRPSSYTKLGLDATVSYPDTDLKIKNTLPFTVMIHAFLPRSTAVRMEILGGDPQARVDYTYAVGTTEDFMRRVTVKPNLPPGKRIRHQKGIPGVEIYSIAKITYADGRSEERHWFSGYRPAPEIYWIPPGEGEADLPPLPEHAKGVEGAPEGGQAATSGPPTSAPAGGRVGG